MTSSSSSVSVQTPSVVVEKRRRSMFLSRHRNDKSHESSVVTNIDEKNYSSSNILTISCRSLATGSFCSSGVFAITSSVRSNTVDILDTLSQSDEEDDDDPPPTNRPVGRSIASSRVFIRTADLPHMELSVRTIQQSLSPSKFPLLDYFHQPSSDPPLPTIPLDKHEESWVALDDGTSGHGMAPLTPAVTSSLVQTGLEAAMTKSMWTPNAATVKLLLGGKWDKTIFQSTNNGQPIPVPRIRGSKEETEALVWVGEFGHKYYGNDIPAARCEGIVNMSPRTLVDLLLDSNRVKEYNKMSIGREDIMIFCNETNRVTKIIVGRSKPPMLGKTLVLKSLLHMEELPSGDGGGGDDKQHCGYVIVSRAIVLKDDVDMPIDPKVLNSEMLMGLNIIRAIEGEENRCVLINLNHLRSPMIPVYLAKRLALGAAVNFLNDIRALC